MLKRLIKKFCEKLGYVLERKKLVERKINAARKISMVSSEIISKLYECSAKVMEETIPAACIIFTKDRPIQLHALLGSMQENVKNVGEIHVLCNASNKEFCLAYDEVFHSFPRLIKSVHYDPPFKLKLIEIVSKIASKCLFFLVDDIFFIRAFDLLEFTNMCKYNTIPSLRLGENITYEQVNNITLKTPIIKRNGGYIKWEFKQGKDYGPWGYPFSLDGNLYLKSELVPILKYLNYKNPNSLEAEARDLHGLLCWKQGVAFQKPRIINIPANSVQTEGENPHMGISTKKLLQLWNEKKQIRYRDYYDMETISAHYECPLVFGKRD